MATLPNMSIITPALGGDSGEWDDKINAALGVIDEHDHTPGSGLLVPIAGLDIDADLALGGHGLTTAGQVAFTAVAALAAGARVIFVSSADNELYWRTNAGTNVKLTSGTSINTSLVGGIVGDYTSVGAEVAYDDANDRYTFKQTAGGAWARIAAGDVRLYEYNTTETVYVGLKVPAALVSSWDVTFPLAAPASTMPVLMDSSGVLSASNTLPGAIVFSTSIQTPTIAGTPNFTGAVTMATTLAVTGIATFTAKPTAPDYNYTSEQTIRINAAAANVVASGGPTWAAGRWIVGTSTGQLWYPITLRTDDVIKSWVLFTSKASASGTITATLVKMTSSTGESATIGVAQTDGTASPGNTTMGQISLTETVTGTTSYALVVTGGGTTGDYFGDLQVNVTRPA